MFTFYFILALGNSVLRLPVFFISIPSRDQCLKLVDLLGYVRISYTYATHEAALPDLILKITW